LAKRRRKKASPIEKRSRMRKMHDSAMSPIAKCIRKACLPAASLFLALNPAAVLAGPEGGQVVGGQGNIKTPNSTTTVINQQSQNLAIDWATFNVNTNELVQFKQPSTSASALNRIFDQNPSQIFGTINANGNVLLVNPHGIFFSPTASVNVNSLIASGLDISTSDFMNGKLNFNGIDGTDGIVVNQGILQAATGGSINLIGKAVSNEGFILATAGQVNMVAGQQVTIDFDGDGLMQFAVDKEVLTNAQSLDAAVSNSGEISADGGSVLLKGSAAKDVFSNVVNNEGIIKAGRIENKGGTIRLVGLGSGSSVLNTGTITADAGDATSSGGTVELTAENVTSSGGTISANATGGDGGTVTLASIDTTLVQGDSVITAKSETAQGGKVKILGDKVGLLGTASIDVSGSKGGGEVLIGGDFQGKNPDIQNASSTFISNNVTINAEAVTSGDGGKVIVWSDEATRFYGDINASGGAESGDGGFVEVSGGYLEYWGKVNLNSVDGQAGTLLLDPDTITISDDSDATGAPQSDVNFDVSGTPGTTITAGILEATTSAGNANIILQANISITIEDLTIGGLGDESIDLDTDVSLTLETRNDGTDGAGFIMFDDPTDSIIASGNGNITFNASTATTSAGNLTTIGNLTTAAGSINLSTNNGTIDIDGNLTTGIVTTDGVASGVISLTSTGNITIDGNLTTGTAIVGSGASTAAETGAITIIASAGDVTGSGTLTTGKATVDGSGPDMDTATSGDITVTANGTNPLQLGTITAGDAEVISVDNAIGITGDIFLTNTGSDIGTSVGVPQAVAGGSLINAGGAITVVTPTASGGSIYLTSNQRLQISNLETSAGADTVDIRTTSGRFTISGAFTNTSTDDITLNSADILTISTSTTDFSGANFNIDAVTTIFLSGPNQLIAGGGGDCQNISRI